MVIEVCVCQIQQNIGSDIGNSCGYPNVPGCTVSDIGDGKCIQRSVKQVPLVFHQLSVGEVKWEEHTQADDGTQSEEPNAACGVGVKRKKGG